MINNNITGEQNTQTRLELAETYFDTFGDGTKSVYAKGNMGIITLLSDIQCEFEHSTINTKEHYRVILNDIKLILITDDKNGGING